MMKRLNLKYSIAFSLLCTVLNLTAQSIEVTGVVFHDKNENKIQDADEPGIPNVVVSDQVNLSLTNSKGNYVLKSANIYSNVFVSLPTGYTGKFYYSKSSTVNFPLSKTKSQQQFKFIHASDPHVDSLNLPRLQRLRKMADSLGVAFVIISGDLIRDALRVNETVASKYYKMFVQEINNFSVPVYCGLGNHEIFGIERDKSGVNLNHPLYGKKMYQHYLGPNYYSFNYGGVHFISVDAMLYQDKYYYGGIDSLQLTWVEKELQFLAPNAPIITFNHIPFVSPGFSFQEFDTDNFYGPQLLTQGKTLEHRHIVYNSEEFMKRLKNRTYLLSLSGHYHAAQEARILGSNTLFAQTSAISGPDIVDFNGFKVESGFTVYEISNTKIISSKFIPLNYKS